MTSPTPDTVASPTRKRLREEDISVKKSILYPPPKRRITKLGSHPQLGIPKFAPSTGTSGDPTPPGPVHLSSQSSIPPSALTHLGSSLPQTNSSPSTPSTPSTPSKRLLINHNGYTRASTGYDPLHQSPWHEFKYAKHNPTEPSSILYFERQRQIARNEADDRARIMDKKRVETKVEAVAAAATTTPIILPRPTKTLTRVRKATTPAPARRIHDPYFFMSERKPTGKPPTGRGFTFGGNHPDARSYHPFVFNPAISRHSTPTRSHSVGDTSAAIPAATLAQTPAQKDSRMANFTATAVAGAARFYVEADSIVNSLARSYSLAKAALVGNRDSKTAERRASQKVAIRKRIEEEERVRRKELFEEFEEFEWRTGQKNRERINATEETSDLDGRSAAAFRNEQMVIDHDVGLPIELDLEFSGANGDPSFVTEDTIPDTVVTEPVYVPETTVIMSSSPIARTYIQSEQSSPIPSPVVYTNTSVALVDKHEESSASLSSDNEDSDGMEIIEPPKPKQVQQVINLDSDDSDEEVVSASSPHLTLGPNHRDRIEHDDEDEELMDEIEGEYDQGEYDEYDEYNEEYDGESDEEELGELEDDEGGDEEIEDTFISIVKSKKFVGESDSELEEINEVAFSESAGSPSGRSDSGNEKGEETKKDGQPTIDYEYIEEETEKDESDAEGGSEWKVKAEFPENIEESADFSLDSTVVIGSSSKQLSNKESTPETPTSARSYAVPEITITSPKPAKVGEPTPALDQEDCPAKLEEERPKQDEFMEAGLIITDDDSDTSHQESYIHRTSPGDLQSVAGGDLEEEYFNEPKSEKAPEEAPISVRRTCIYRVGNDVFNKNNRCIGKCRDDGFVEAPDAKVVGWMSALGEFHRLQSSLDLRIREITKEELYAYPDGMESISRLHEGKDFDDEKFECLTLSNERQEALGMGTGRCSPEPTVGTEPNPTTGMEEKNDGVGGYEERVDVQEGETEEIGNLIMTEDEQGANVEQDDRLEDEEEVETYDAAITDGGGGAGVQPEGIFEGNDDEIMADTKENDDQITTVDESGVVWQDDGPEICAIAESEDGAGAGVRWDSGPEETDDQAVAENKEGSDRVIVEEEGVVNVEQDENLETHNTIATEDEEMVDVQQEHGPEKIDDQAAAENKESDDRGAIEDEGGVNVGQDKLRTCDTATTEDKTEFNVRQKGRTGEINSPNDGNDEQVTITDEAKAKVEQDDVKEVSVEDDKLDEATTEDGGKAAHDRTITPTEESSRPFFGPPQQTTYEFLRRYTSEAAAWQIRQVNGHESPFKFQCDNELTKAFDDGGMVIKQAPRSDAQVKEVIGGGEGVDEAGGIFGGVIGGEGEGDVGGEENRNEVVEGGGDVGGEENRNEVVEGGEDEGEVEEEDSVAEGEEDGVAEGEEEEEEDEGEEGEDGVAEEEGEGKEEEEEERFEMLVEDQLYGESVMDDEEGKEDETKSSSAPTTPPSAHEPTAYKRKRLVPSPIDIPTSPLTQENPKRHIRDARKHTPTPTPEAGSPTTKRPRTTPGVVIEASVPSSRMTRKRAREASTEPTADELPTSPKKLRRGRSASIEPPTLIATAEPKPRAKKPVAAEAPSGEREVVAADAIEADSVAGVAHNHQSSADLSDDTDTSVRGLRRSARAAAKGVVPGTPRKKRARKYPIEPLSAIREADVEGLVGKGATRISTRRKGAVGAGGRGV